jgi:RNA ligase (TIGR02306 family)
MLGIAKWIPEIPANMGGEVFAAPRILHWIEIDNVKAYPDLFMPGEAVQASEKAHGSACLCSVDLSATDPSEAFLVSSKGMGGHNLALIEDPNNLYWRALRQHEVEAKARALINLLEGQRVALAPDLHYQITRLGIFGEVYGAGVQDLTYGINSRNTPGYAVFDIYVESVQESSYWLDQTEVRELCAQVGLPMVPTLYEGPYDYETLAVLAEGETVLGEGRHLREGLVVRPAHERYSPELGTRLILKFINPDYLTRKDGTEFE